MEEVGKANKKELLAVIKRTAEKAKRAFAGERDAYQKFLEEGGTDITEDEKLAWFRNRVRELMQKQREGGPKEFPALFQTETLDPEKLELEEFKLWLKLIDGSLTSQNIHKWKEEIGSKIKDRGRGDFSHTLGNAGMPFAMLHDLEEEAN